MILLWCAGRKIKFQLPQCNIRCVEIINNVHHVPTVVIACRHITPGHHLYAWWRHQMEIFSTLLALCAGNSPVTSEFPTQRQVTRSFGVFFDLRLNQQLSKQWGRRWFETLSCSSWRFCNGRIGSKHWYIKFTYSRISCWVCVYDEVCSHHYLVYYIRGHVFSIDPLFPWWSRWY